MTPEGDHGRSKVAEGPATRVYKYPLRFEGFQYVVMPYGAEIVHVHEQNEAPCMWAVVNTSAPEITRTFGVFATGVDVPYGGVHKGTVHIDWTVWHIFDFTDHFALVEAAKAQREARGGSDG